MKYLLIVLTTCLLFNACMPLNSLVLLEPDRKDMERFPYKNIEANNDDCFEFYKSEDDYANELKVNDWTSDLPVFVDIETLVKSHSVRSFLVIRNDSLLYEYYGLGTDKTSLHSSYSIAKSFVSALIGIAVNDGDIKSEQELAVNYLPEIAQFPESETLTIEHLLNHTSGIKSALNLDATIYYGKDIIKSFDRMQFENPPGVKQSYVNMNVQMLGIILERATGKTPSEYLQEKIWKPLNMCNNAIWSIDEVNQMEKTFCCMGATAEDYAKFGRLFLNQGNWNGEQIISPQWYNKSIKRDTLNGSSYNYNYCWHIGLKEYNDFMANGKYKQHIYVNSNKNLVFVLLNDKESKLKATMVNWWDVFRQLADQL